MANVLGLLGLNKSDGTDTLIAVWKNAPVLYNVTTGGWNKAPIHLSTQGRVSTEKFLDYGYLTNGLDYLYRNDGTLNGWVAVTEAPLAYYIKRLNVRLYLGNITIGSRPYTSRTWYCDLPKNDKTISWGISWGSNLSQTASSAVVTSDTGYFIDRGIDVGDTISILTGDNVGEYTVSTVDSNTQLTLTKVLTYTATNSEFIVGNNYYDVNTDDGDVLMGYGVANNELLNFKRNSLHRFNDVSLTLRQVKDAPGTSSSASIVSFGGYCYYYHPEAGILRCNGYDSKVISDPIYDVLAGVSSSNYSNIVAWKENERLIRFYLGDVTLRDNSTITGCVATFDTKTDRWAGFGSFPIAVTAATEWSVSNIRDTYLGDSNGKVYKTDDGYSFAGTAIPFSLEYDHWFPFGQNTIMTYRRLRIFHENGFNLSGSFRLIYKQNRNGDFISDTDYKPLILGSRGDITEMIFPDSSRAIGLGVKFFESSDKKGPIIKKIVVYGSDPSDI